MNRAPHPFSLRQVQYAVAVAETGSFRKAAEACRVAQPSLSAQVAQLEDALGVRLFERDRRGVLVTRAGAQLLERARALLVGADDLLEAARRMGDPLAGPLRVGVIPTIAPYLLPDASPALRKAFPKLALQWVEERTPVLAGRLARGEVDAAVLALEADLGAVEHAEIGKDPFVLACAPGHPLGKARGRAGVDELSGVPVLLLEDGHCLRDQALAVCGRTDARELAFRATSLPTLVQMVAAGAGVTLLPELAVPVEAPRGRLCVRRFKAPAPHRTIVLAWRRGSPRGTAFRTLAACMKEAYPRTGRPSGAPSGAP